MADYLIKNYRNKFMCRNNSHCTGFRIQITCSDMLLCVQACLQPISSVLPVVVSVYSPSFFLSSVD
jgi:hypothetical protein